MSLFCAAFIVLALASYLFGLVSGDNMETVCKRVWTEMTVASGLLGVGAIGVVSGIGWLLAAYLGDEGRRADGPGGGATAQDLTHLGRLVRLMLYGIATITAVLMAVTVIEYLMVWFDSSPPPWLIWQVLLYPLYVLTVIIVLAVRRRSDSRTKAFFIGVFSSVAYALLGAVFVGVIASTRAEFWVSPPTAMVVVTTLLALLLPAPSLIALVHAVPRLPGVAGENLAEELEPESVPSDSSDVPTPPKRVEAVQASGSESPEQTVHDGSAGVRR